MELYSCSRVVEEWVKKNADMKAIEALLSKTYPRCCLLVDKVNGGLGMKGGLKQIDMHTLCEVNGKEEVCVDVQKKKVVKAGKTSLRGIKHNQILDLSDDGERWEGDVFHGKPYGWGVLYDKENQMVYEGFRIGDVNVCYGRSYYSDIQRVEYEGEWFEGQRWGRGIQYDRKGSVLYDGDWIEDQHMSRRVEMKQSIDSVTLHTLVEEIIVEDGVSCESDCTSLNLSLLTHLRVFIVGEGCFGCVSELILTNLNRLEVVLIGRSSFTNSNTGNEETHRFCLRDCERLRKVKIDCFAFQYYSVCEIENLNRVEEIEIGKYYNESYCFRSSSFLLRSSCPPDTSQIDLPKLHTLSFGEQSFIDCTTAVFERMGVRYD